MAEVSIVHIEIDGLEDVDVKKVYEGKRTVRKAANLMHRTGKIRTRQRPTVGFDRAIVEGKPAPDYASMEDISITIIYEDGTRIKYLGCSCTEVGETTYDEENEAIQRYDFIADERVED